MIFDDYDPPVPDRLLYFIAHKINLYGDGDVEEMVQEGRIKVWQMWQEFQWVRGKAQPNDPKNYYAKAAQRRMQAVCYGNTHRFGGVPRGRYQDVLDRAERILDDDENFVQPAMEIPFELLDRIPGTLLAAMVLQTA